MDLGLRGKTALSTGASCGLGFAAAQVIAKESARIANAAASYITGVMLTDDGGPYRGTF